MQARLNFFSFLSEIIVGNESIIINTDLLTFLWDELVNNSSINEEKELFFDWFSIITQYTTINQNSIIEFFISKMKQEKE